MEYYVTLRDLNETIGIMPVLQTVVTAVPPFFTIILFLIFLLGTASSYFAVLKTTGKKRFWHCLTSMSFSTFILSLIVVVMNTETVTYLNGYWVGFYTLMTLGSWFMLSNYK